MATSALGAALRRELETVAGPAKAPAMQAYMKSSMPYLGVPAPLVRSTCRRVFGDYALPSAAARQRAVLGLWRDAGFREERSAAIALSGDRRAAAFHTPAALRMYEEMIVTGAWWDYVDELAISTHGPMHARSRAGCVHTTTSSPLSRREARKNVATRGARRTAR